MRFNPLRAFAASTAKDVDKEPKIGRKIKDENGQCWQEDPQTGHWHRCREDE